MVAQLRISKADGIAEIEQKLAQLSAELTPPGKKQLFSPGRERPQGNLLQGYLELDGSRGRN